MARYGSGSVPIATGWKCTNCRRTHRSSIPRSASGNTRARPALTTDTSRPPRNWSAPCPGSSERCNTILSQSDPICFLFADRYVPLIMRGCIEGKMMNRRRCWWTELCGLMLLLPLMASAQQLNLSVGNIPPAATRLVAVVDGVSISGTLRGSQDISAGIGSSTFSMGVPSGGPYRIRVIAFTSGSTFPAVLRSGKTTGVSVSTSGSTSASVTLGDVTGAVDPSTPTSASAGAQVTIKINITDPGDFLAGVSSGRLWSSTSPLTQNTTGAQTSGTLSSLGNGLYQFAGTVNLPTSGGTLYYQFGEAAPAFDNPNGTEAPFLDWPNLQTGAQPLKITMSSAAGISLSVGNIPPAATRLVAVVDGGSISGTLRGSQDVSAGIGSSTFSMGVPSGGPYRIRVIAFTSGSTFPALLRSGKTTGVSVSTSGSTSASVTLGDRSEEHT